jgi:hypothetical protein
MAAEKPRVVPAPGLTGENAGNPVADEPRILLYQGRRVVPFAAAIHALPVSALWHLGATSQPPTDA